MKTTNKKKNKKKKYKFNFKKLLNNLFWLFVIIITIICFAEIVKKVQEYGIDFFFTTWK